MITREEIIRVPVEAILCDLKIFRKHELVLEKLVIITKQLFTLKYGKMFTFYDAIKNHWSA